MFEGFAVFALVNGLGFGADHFNSVFVQHAGAMQGHGGVERGLAAEGGEQREFVWGGFVRRDAERCGRDARAPRNRNTHALHLVQFADDDFFHGFGRDWLDVGAIGELRVGHDGGRVGVDENDAVALFLEGFAGLGAGIVELARLADEDRSGADDEDGVNVSALGHLAELDFGLRIFFALRRSSARSAPAAWLVFPAGFLVSGAVPVLDFRPARRG